jgi:prepilin-type processing-associated H-X9-DG protein
MDQARFRAGDARYAALKLAVIAAPADVGMLADCRVNRMGAVFNMRWRIAFANTPGSGQCSLGSPNANQPGTIPCWKKRHNTGQNIAFADGHVKHVISRDIMYRLVLNPWHPSATSGEFPRNPCFFANFSDCTWIDPVLDTRTWPWD